MGIAQAYFKINLKIATNSPLHSPMNISKQGRTGNVVMLQNCGV